MLMILVRYSLDMLCRQIYESHIWEEIWAGNTTLGVVSVAVALLSNAVYRLDKILYLYSRKGVWIFFFSFFKCPDVN